MTKTVQIERLIELLSSIAGKFAANPTMSHLVTDGVEDNNIEGLILKLDDCAKKTAVKSFEADFIAFQEDTPTLEDPQSIRVWEAQDGFKFFMVDSESNHDAYLVPLKYVTIGDVRYEVAGGHINVTTGVATITHIKETLSPADEWHKSNTYDGSFYVTRNIKKSNTDFLSKYSECVALDSYAYGYCAASNKNLNFWYMEAETTTDEFKEWLATHPIEVAYELANSVQMQLDPVTVKTLNDTTCYIQTYQGCISHVAGEYIRDISAAIEALEDIPTVEINKEGVTPSANAETITIDTDTFAINGVEINKEGVTPSETLTTLTQGETSYSIASGSRSVEILAGDITATFTGATPSYALPSADTSLPDGKHWLDYDEIIIVTIYQQTPSANVPRLYEYKSIPTWAFQTGHNDSNYGVTVTCTDNFNGSAGQGARVCLLADDKYRNDWCNYASPIAILGVKY